MIFIFYLVLTPRGDMSALHTEMTVLVVVPVVTTAGQQLGQVTAILMCPGQENCWGATLSLWTGQTTTSRLATAGGLSASRRTVSKEKQVGK